MSEGVLALLMLLAMAGGLGYWRGTARYFRKHGHGIVVRHALGLVAGFLALMLMALILEGANGTAGAVTAGLAVLGLAFGSERLAKRRARSAGSESDAERSQRAQTPPAPGLAVEPTAPPAEPSAEPPTATGSAPLAAADEISGNVREAVIVYESSNGDVTSRPIRVHACNQEYFEAMCFLRGGSRTFRFDRVHSVALAETGEVVPVDSWVDALRALDLPKQIATNPEQVTTRRVTHLAPMISPGARVVFTGFAAARRAELESLAADAGWSPGTKVTAKTAVLVTGPTAGPAKKTRAKEIGAHVVTESEFVELAHAIHYQH